MQQNSESAMGESLAYLTQRICSVAIHSYGKRKKKDLTRNKKNAFFFKLWHKSDKNREKHDKLLQTQSVRSHAVKKQAEINLSMLHFTKNKYFLWSRVTDCTMSIQHFSSTNTRNNTKSVSKVSPEGRQLNLNLSYKWRKLNYAVAISSNAHTHIK